MPNERITMNNEVPAVYMQYVSYRDFSLEDVGNPLQENPTPEPDTFRIQISSSEQFIKNFTSKNVFTIS